MRSCCTCKIEKPLNSDNFYRSKNEKDGFCYRCKLCAKKYQNNRWATNTNYRQQVSDSYQKNWLKNYRKRKYNITQNEYDALLQKFNKCCAICKGNDCLCIDHCHTTGEIRGILCRNCNSAIGLLQEKVHILESAIAYLNLRKHIPLQINKRTVDALSVLV